MLWIGFSAGGSWIAKAIRFVTRSETNHCFILFYDPLFKQTLVAEADMKGFIITTFDNFSKNNKIIKLVPIELPEAQIHYGLQEMAGWLGKSYDYGGLFGFLIILFGRTLRRRWKNPFQKKSSLFCSEAATTMLQIMNYHGAEVLIPEETSPKTLMAFLGTPSIS